MSPSDRAARLMRVAIHWRKARQRYEREIDRDPAAANPGHPARIGWLQAVDAAITNATAIDREYGYPFESKVHVSIIGDDAIHIGRDPDAVEIWRQGREDWERDMAGRDNPDDRVTTYSHTVTA